MVTAGVTASKKNSMSQIERERQITEQQKNQNRKLDRETDTVEVKKCTTNNAPARKTPKKIVQNQCVDSYILNIP